MSREGEEARMAERRKVKRRHLIYYLRVFDRASGRQLGHLVDLTADGMMLMSERPIRVGRTLALKMALPGGTGGEQIVEFDATSLWTSEDINPDFYDTGFKFEKISRKHLAQIETLVDDYGFRD
jgi:hypothetical protein